MNGKKAAAKVGNNWRERDLPDPGKPTRRIGLYYEEEDNHRHDNNGYYNHYDCTQGSQLSRRQNHHLASPFLITGGRWLVGDSDVIAQFDPCNVSLRQPDSIPRTENNHIKTVYIRFPGKFVGEKVASL